MNRLPLLIVESHSRCNCRCSMCDIWRETEDRRFTAADLKQLLVDLETLGTKHVVFTGGEPLMNPDLIEQCSTLRSRGVRVTVLTAGLLLERFASAVAGTVDDVIVSLDGPPTVHDEVRRTIGAFDAIRRGIRAVRAIRQDFPMAARCVVQKANVHCLLETVDAARLLGFDSISFLAADLTSNAFNRIEAWPILRQSAIGLDRDDIVHLERTLPRLKADPLVKDSPEHLERIVSLCRAHFSPEPRRAPQCNAPFISAYLRADGSVQPCFFHSPVGSVKESGLSGALKSPDALQFRAELDVPSNPVCQRCVCSLYMR